MKADGPAVVVSGYASIDETYTATRLAGPAETGVLSGPVRPVSRHGGCGPNTARVLAQLGVRTAVVTWIGDDAEGRAFVQSLSEVGVDLRGVEIGHGPSPRSLLIYDASGDAACYFHPSRSASQAVGADVRQLVGGAQWLVVTVGPPPVTEALLAARGNHTRVAWGVKADAEAFPPELCGRLIGADLVCLNQKELAFVARALRLEAATPQALLERGAGCVVLTRGADGYTVVTPKASTEGSVQETIVVDATGAGDAFLGGLLAALVGGDDAVKAAALGAAVARDYLLRGRVPEQVRP